MKDESENESDQWIPWEVAYSLKEITRNDRTSHTNGILAAVLPDQDSSYSYFLEEDTCSVCHCRNLRTDKLFQILRDNMFNIKELYCHRKFRPLSNIRLCYNDNPFERRIPMAKRRRFTAKFKAEVVLEALGGESSQAELCRRHNLSENQVSTWKRQLLENVETFFESADKQSSESAERIVQLEQLVGRLTLALEIQKKASTLLD